MLTQVQPQPIAPDALPVQHLVTLINRFSGQEVSLIIATATDRFTEVVTEVSRQKAIRGLKGFEIFEVLDLAESF